MDLNAEHVRMMEVLQRSGYTVVPPKIGPEDLPERDTYRIQVFPWPTFMAELTIPEIGRVKQRLAEKNARSLVAPVKMAALSQLLSAVAHLEGEIWEGGVYQGGSALLISEVVHVTLGADTPLRLFDTFCGMPATNPRYDRHLPGQFGDSSLDMVRDVIGERAGVHYHPGLIPQSFGGLEECTIKFAHLDLDIFESITATLAFVYPRMPAGVIVCDDYGFWSCPGAKQAVDAFFRDKPETPLTLHSGQAVIFKVGDHRARPQRLNDQR